MEERIGELERALERVRGLEQTMQAVGQQVGGEKKSELGEPEKKP